MKITIGAVLAAVLAIAALGLFLEPTPKAQQLPTAQPSFAQARGLPPCDSETVHKTFAKITEARTDGYLILSEDLAPDTKVNKRWCNAFYMNERWRTLEAVFTLEWINESSGQFWLQIIQVSESRRPWHLLVRPRTEESK
jgi:hypothetical protein